MNNLPRPRLMNFHTLVIAAGIVMVWRGIWGLMDVYLFPGNPTLSYALSIAIGLVILYVDDMAIDELKHK